MRVLLVANQTLGGAELAQHLSELHASEPGLSLHVLVPAAVVGVIADPSEMLSLLAVDVEAERREAEARMNTLIDWLRRGGVPASGEITVAQPLLAVATAVRSRRFDRVILSTFPPGVSRWLRMDLAHRVKRMCDLPVTTIINDSGVSRPPELLGVAQATRTAEIDTILVASEPRLARLRSLTQSVSVPLHLIECADVDAAIVAVDGLAGGRDHGALVALEVAAPKSALDALARLKAHDPELSVSMLSDGDDPAARTRAHELGASAFFVLIDDPVADAAMFEIVATEFVALQRLRAQDLPPSEA